MESCLPSFRIFRCEGNAVPEALINMNSKAQTIKAVCDNLLGGDPQSAADTARNGYPFARRSLRAAFIQRLNHRDIRPRGFIDRYSGTQLIFPELFACCLVCCCGIPVSSQLEDDRNVHAIGNCSRLSTTLSLSRGGADNEKNWVTTSMLHNSAKSNWTLEELGDSWCRPGNQAVGWFIRVVRHVSPATAVAPSRQVHQALARVALPVKTDYSGGI